jgi:hypothetical protein
MASLFNTLAPDVRAILAEYRCHGRGARRLVGRGHFSAVFAYDNSVLKFTIDKASYTLCTKHRPWKRSKHFPKLIRDHGIVGEIQLDPVSRESVYLMELERLNWIFLDPYAPEVGSPQSELADHIVESFHNCGERILGSVDYLNMDNRTPQVVTAILREVAQEEDPLIPAPIRAALLDLSRFVWDYRSHHGSNVGAGVDFHRENFMRRGEMGELVFSDPVLDRRIHESYSDRELSESGSE